MTQTKNYPSDRKSPVKLSDSEKYAIYKHCIENHAVVQVGNAVEYRVNRERIAKELNMLGYIKDEDGKTRVIGAHHIVQSIEDVINWQRLIDKLPAVPQETAELEQLRIEKIKVVKENEQLKLDIEKLAAARVELSKEIERLKKSDAQNKIDRIRAIVSV